MAASSITGGFDIDGDLAEAGAVDTEPQTIEEELALRVIAASRRGHRHAAFTAAAELLRQVAARGGISVTVIE